MKLIERTRVFIGNLTKKLDFRRESATPLQWLLTLMAMIVIRLLIIDLASGFHGKEGGFLLAFFFQDLFFFLETLLLIWIWLALILKMNPQKLFGLMFWGTWLVILPPIIDLVFFQKIFWSFYLFSDLKLLGLQYLTFFGHLPPAIVYFGTKLSAVAAVLITSAFVYQQTHKYWKTILNGVVVYSIFFFMGSFPSWLTFLHHSLTRGMSISAVSIPDISAFILSPVEIFGIKYYFLDSALMFKLNLIFFMLAFFLGVVLWKISDKQGFVIFLRARIRKNKLFVNGAMFLLGFGVIGAGLYPSNFDFSFFAWVSLAVLITSLWASLIADQFFFEQKGKNENNHLPDKTINLLNIIALSGFILIGVKFFLLMFAYKIVLWVFWGTSFPVLKNRLAGHFLDWMMCILSIAEGFMLMSSEQSLDHFPVGMIAWFTLGIIVISSSGGAETREERKNLPDIFSDTAKRLIQETLIFILFVLGVVVMHKASLFIWAILLGGISFWVTEKEYRQKKRLIMALFLVYFCLGLVI